MKKIMLIALAATVLAACAKENEPVIAPQTSTEEGAPVHLTFGGPDRFTRAVFDDTAVAEEWEKRIGTMMVYVLNSEGEQVMQKRFSGADLDAMSTDFDPFAEDVA